MAHPRSLPSAPERPDVGGGGDVRPQVPGARRERNAVETKKRILEAAGAEFAAKGYDGARLGNIARQAGIQQALIHHYFEDKARLFEAVLALGLESMTKGVWDLLEQLGFRGKTERREHVTRDDIRILAEAFIGVLFRFYSHNGVFLAMVGHESRTNREQAHRVLVDNVRPLFEAIVGRIREMSENGNVPVTSTPRTSCSRASPWRASPSNKRASSRPCGPRPTSRARASSPPARRPS